MVIFHAGKLLFVKLKNYFMDCHTIWWAVVSSPHFTDSNIWNLENGQERFSYSQLICIWLYIVWKISVFKGKLFKENAEWPLVREVIVFIRAVTAKSFIALRSQQSSFLASLRLHCLRELLSNYQELDMVETNVAGSNQVYNWLKRSVPE